MVAANLVYGLVAITNEQLRLGKLNDEQR